MSNNGRARRRWAGPTPEQSTVMVPLSAYLEAVDQEPNPIYCFVRCEVREGYCAICVGGCEAPDPTDELQALPSLPCSVYKNCVGLDKDAHRCDECPIG